MRSLLTLPGSFGNTGLPQTVQGLTDASPVPHTVEKNGHICFCQQAARGVSSGWFRYWRNNVLMFVRLRRLCTGRGALFPPSFFIQFPKLYRCIMLRFFLSSRFLRLRYRLSSLFTRSIYKAAMVALFGLLLAVSLLPELFLAGGAR